jgi:peptidoglycan/xylan/chitin deacetylase (PgdA/CDA1 family)
MNRIQKVVNLNGGVALPTTVLPRFLLSNPGSEWEGFDTFAQWTQDSGLISNDTVNKRTGTASLAVNSNAGGAGGGRKTTNTTFGAAPRMRLSFYLTDTFAELNNIQLRMTHGNAAFATYKMAQWNRFGGFHHGWNTADIFPTDWTDYNNEVWTSPTATIKIQANRQAATTVHASFDSLVYGLVSVPSVIFSFDDGFSDLYTKVYPYLKLKNMRGNTFMITDNINGGGYCTAAQLQEMSANGSVMIGNHTNNHGHLNWYDLATQTAMIKNGKDALTALGITTGDHLAYPFGDWDENTLTACANLGIKTARTVQNISYPLVSADQFLLLSSYPVVNTDTLASMKAVIDLAKSKGTTVWFQFHQIVDSPTTTYEWATADFRALVDYAKAQSVVSLTLDEFYNTNAGTVTIRHY